MGCNLSTRFSDADLFSKINPYFIGRFSSFWKCFSFYNRPSAHHNLLKRLPLNRLHHHLGNFSRIKRTMTSSQKDVIAIVWTICFVVNHTTSQSLKVASSGTILTEVTFNG